MRCYSTWKGVLRVNVWFETLSSTFTVNRYRPGSTLFRAMLFSNVNWSPMLPIWSVESVDVTTDLFVCMLTRLYSTVADGFFVFSSTVRLYTCIHMFNR